MTITKTEGAPKPSLILKKANLLALLTDSIHSEQAPFLYCALINALTGAACSQVINHLYDVRFSRTTDELPSLDERNEQDEADRGQDVVDFVSESNGFTVPMKPLEAVKIIDGIRHDLYSEMFQWGDFATEGECAGKDPLVFTPPQAITARPNYNQPMSAQMYMDFRIDNAERLDEGMIRMGAKRLKIAEDVIREAMLVEARKSKARLLELRPKVLAELDGLNFAYDVSAFTKLDIDTQVYIAEKVSTRVDREYQRLLPKAVRSLEFGAQLDAVESMFHLIKDWMKANDQEYQDAVAVRKSLMQQ